MRISCCGMEAMEVVLQGIGWRMHGRRWE